MIMNHIKSFANAKITIQYNNNNKIIIPSETISSSQPCKICKPYVKYLLNKCIILRMKVDLLMDEFYPYQIVSFANCYERSKKYSILILQKMIYCFCLNALCFHLYYYVLCFYRVKPKQTQKQMPSVIECDNSYTSFDMGGGLTFENHR